MAQNTKLNSLKQWARQKYRHYRDSVRSLATRVNHQSPRYIINSYIKMPFTQVTILFT